MNRYNKKQYEECFERLDKYVFSRDVAIKEDWYDLLNYHHNQLQSYKQKEDKLREHCKLGISELNYEISDWLDDSKTENNDVIEDLEIQKQIFKDILQILNEGEI